MNILLDIFVPIVLIGAFIIILVQVIYLNLHTQKDLIARRRAREAPEPIELIEWWRESTTDYILRTNRGTYRGWSAWWYDHETARNLDHELRSELCRIYREIEWGRHQEKLSLERVKVEVVKRDPEAPLKLLGPGSGKNGGSSG